MKDSTCYVILDVDWAPDFVVDFALDELEALSIEATVFVTHESPVLDRLRSSESIEVGVHPNFNDLLQGTAPEGDSMRSRVENLRKLVPEATAVRSHSLVQSSRLLDLFTELGFSHEANVLIPTSADIRLSPWRHWDGRLLRVPCLFEDSVADRVPDGWSAQPLLDHGGLRVLNFHPIRLFLNAREVALHPEVGPSASPEFLTGLRRSADDVGSLQLLRDVVTRHRAAGGGFGRISEIRLTEGPTPHEVSP